MRLPFRTRINGPVFWMSAVFIIAVVVFGAAFTETAGATFEALQMAIVRGFGWYYVLCATFFVGFAVWLLFSAHGDLRLGPEDEPPDYGLPSWFAMLFSAGIGIAVLFYGVAEPILHYTQPPHAAPRTQAAAQEALGYTFLHWGFHGWAMYVLVGLSLAYFGFRRGLPLTIRSALYPIFGERIKGWVGHAADTFAVLGTMFGVATSLGLGATQLNAGLATLFTSVPADAAWVQVALIAGITGMATTSVVLGLGRGIRRLSIVNMLLAVALMAFVFLFGPTVHLLESFAQNVGHYLSTFVERSFQTDAFGSAGETWMGDWTLFYWGWWIAWSPFVGMFIARVSRGRTIREFVWGVLMAASGFMFLWMTIFGNAALYYEMNGVGQIAATVNENLPGAFFALLDLLPAPAFTSVLALLLMMTFFVSSSDSGSLVIDIITAGGDPDPPVAQRIFWALLEGCVAAVLLLAGGLEALRAASITSALPFSVVLLAAAYGLAKALREEGRTGGVPSTPDALLRDGHPQQGKQVAEPTTGDGAAEPAAPAP